MSENLTSEMFCSTNFLLSEIFFRYLKIITCYFDSLTRIVLSSSSSKMSSSCSCRTRGCILSFFQLLDSSSLLVSSDVQRLLPLQKQIPEGDPFKNIRITQ